MRPTLPTCPSGNCGQEKFRRAVPLPAAVTIPFGKFARTAHRPGSMKQGLESVAPAFVAVEAHVGEINGLVTGIFSDLEEMIATTPLEATDELHTWRRPDADVPGLDEVLELRVTAEGNYDLRYGVGPEGFDPTSARPVLHGVIAPDASAFDLLVDYDELSAQIEGLGAQGDLRIRLADFAGGQFELWYDFTAFSDGTAPPEDSITTFWMFDDASGALEFIGASGDVQQTAYARWNLSGGRYDHQAEYAHPDLGEVEEIFTNCWSDTGAETFDGWALVDATGAYYGELDGVEAACAWAPIADHPSPGTSFDRLPYEGEWDDLEMNTYARPE